MTPDDPRAAHPSPVDLRAPAHERFLLGSGPFRAALRGGPGIEDFDLSLDSARPAEAGASPALGRLRWHWGPTEAAPGHRRLGLADLVRVENGPHAMEAFLSAADRVLVADTTVPVVAQGGFSFSSPHPGVEVRVFEDGDAEWLVAAGADRAVAAAWDGRRLIVGAARGFRGADLPPIVEAARADVRAALPVDTDALRRRGSRGEPSTAGANTMARNGEGAVTWRSG